MRILYLHQFFATPECAAGTRSYEFGRALVERGHEVTIVTGTAGLGPWLGESVHDRGQELERDGMTIVTVPDRYEQTRNVLKRVVGYQRYVSGAIRAGARRGPFDVILATSPPLPICIAGAALKKIHRCPLVFEVRDLWPLALIAFGSIEANHPGIVAAKLLERFAYRAADRMIATTPGARRNLMGRGLNGDDIDVVVLGADPDLFEPGCSDGSFRAKHGLEDKFIALFPGAHGIANGLDRVLDAAKVLQDRDSRVHFVLVGNGSEKPALIEQAERLGLNNVLFHGLVPKVELVKMVDEADVGLAVLAPCSILDIILSNKMFDFIAAGKPVVANLPGDMQAILEGEDCGVYTPDMSPEGFADAMQELSERPAAELEAMGKRGRALAEGRYARKNLAEDFERVLLRAVGQG